VKNKWLSLSACITSVESNTPVIKRMKVKYIYNTTDASGEIVDNETFTNTPKIPMSAHFGIRLKLGYYLDT
jgi:hypothetical protein